MYLIKRGTQYLHSVTLTSSRSDALEGQLVDTWVNSERDGWSSMKKEQATCVAALFAGAEVVPSCPVPTAYGVRQ